MSWHNLAIDLYYNEGLKVVEIAEKVEKTKQAVSKFLSNENPEKYIKEKERRKERSKEREKIRKRNWKRENSGGVVDIDYILLKQQHESDVAFLSGSIASYGSLFDAGYLQSAYEKTNGKIKRRDTTECGAVIPKSLPRYINK